MSRTVAGRSPGLLRRARGVVAPSLEIETAVSVEASKVPVIEVAVDLALTVKTVAVPGQAGDFAERAAHEVHNPSLCHFVTFVKMTFVTLAWIACSIDGRGCEEPGG
jgi:hypothetical protein